LKFTLKSDYALNIIAIDKPPKYELKDTSCSTEKSSLLQVYCVRHQLFQCNFGIFIANEAAEENRKKKRDTPYAQIIDSILIYGNFSSGLLDKSFL